MNTPGVLECCLAIWTTFKGITITYNHLDLPELISFDDGRKIECLYDASGRLWSKVLKASDGSTLQTRNYVGSFELIDNLPYSVMHSEGRMVNEGLEGYLSYLYLDHQQKVAEQFRADEIESTGQIALDHTEYEGRTAITLSGGFEVSTGAEFSGEIVGAGTYSESWRYEWDIRDHLGNLRMTYTGPDRNNLEILQRQSYYPYGQVINKNLATTLENKYAYNGIDWVGDFGLDWSMATYRSLDSRGVWNSVDPKAEMLPGLSPYQSMNNNPISFTDPEGDLPFLALVGIGAASGIFSNGLSNVSQGQGFFQGAGSAALWGGIGAAASFGIDQAFQGVGSFGNELGRGVAHGLSTGLQSELQGGSFGQGFLSGGLSSGIGSGISALGGGGFDQILGGGLSGGLGSAIAGGNFFDGFGQGVAVGAFNHSLHTAADPPDWLKKWWEQIKRTRAENQAFIKENNVTLLEVPLLPGPGGAVKVAGGLSKFSRVPKGEIWYNFATGKYQKGGTFISQKGQYLRSKLIRSSSDGLSTALQTNKIVQPPVNIWRTRLEAFSRFLGIIN